MHPINAQMRNNNNHENPINVNDEEQFGVETAIQPRARVNNSTVNNNIILPDHFVTVSADGGSNDADATTGRDERFWSSNKFKWLVTLVLLTATVCALTVRGNIQAAHKRASAAALEEAYRPQIVDTPAPTCAPTAEKSKAPKAEKTKAPKAEKTKAPSTKSKSPSTKSKAPSTKSKAPKAEKSKAPSTSKSKCTKESVTKAPQKPKAAKRQQ